MPVEQQHGFPGDDEPTRAAHLRLKLVRFDGPVGPAPDDRPTETAELHITTRPDERAERRRVPSPMRVIAIPAGLIRQFLGRLRM